MKPTKPCRLGELRKNKTFATVWNVRMCENEKNVLFVFDLFFSKKSTLNVYI